MCSQLPRVYFVQGVENSPALDSILIPDGVLVDYPNPCSECYYFCGRHPSDLFVQGFDDIEDLDPATTGFLPEGPPLIGAAAQIETLAALLTGVTTVRVGFKNWNQREVATSGRFARRPKLAALYVNSICSRAFLPSGEEFERCPSCGRMIVWWQDFRDDIRKMRIDPASYPQTDLFLIDGGTQEEGICITENGIEKLKAAGFTNIIVEEIGWAT